MKEIEKKVGTVFSIGAALRSEKVKTAKRINLCDSFVKLAIVAKKLANCRTDGTRNIVSFECDECGIVDDYSSKNWESLFHFERLGKIVIIKVPANYILGPVISGYH